MITGDSIYNVPLTVDDDLPAPRFSNFEAAQQGDPAKDFTLRWVDFTGVGEREIWLEVVDEATLATVFDAGPLDPSDTSAVIPAGTLLADATYRARLTFTRYTHVSPGTMPETYSGFEAYNTMPLKATSGGSPPDPATITGYRVLENGDLELTANCTPDRTLTLQGAADLNAAWSNLQTTTPTISPAVLTVPKASLGNRLFIRLFQE